MSTDQLAASQAADVPGVWIDGSMVASDGERRLPIVDPTSERTTGSIADGVASDVDRAVAAATRAATGWAASATARADGLRRLGDLVEEHAADLAAHDVAETGRIHGEATAQIKATARWYRYFAGLADKIHGETNPVDSPSMMSFTIREPLGVIGCITAWNAPLLLAGIKLAPALAAGNTVVIKPSEYASSSTLALARLCTQAGIPDGVVNVVTGSGKSVGEPLVAHPGVAHISFTGSPAAGAAIAASAGRHLKGVTLELGGKSPNIIFADADLDAAIPGVAAGIFSLTGQSCIAGSRVLVQRPIYDDVVDKLRDHAERIVVGDSNDPGATMGPVANRPQLDKVEHYAGLGQTEGARLVTGGQRVERDGFFFAPTIFADVDNRSRLASEEIFGPIMSVIPFDTEAEAVSIANHSEYGLAAGVWTRDGARALRMAKALQSGTVFINTYRALHPGVPFGGVKKSGVGRENGLEALLDFTQVKSVWIETGGTDSH